MSDLADLAQLIRARQPIAGIRQYRNADLADLGSAKKSTAVDDLLAAIKAQEAQTYERLKNVPLDERVGLRPSYETLQRAGRLARETGLTPGMARPEDFTPPTRTMEQELGKSARELGGWGMLTTPIPVVGSYTTPVSSALLALGALQELVHPYREEGENRLWGAAELAGAALPYTGKIARQLRQLRPATKAAETLGGGGGGGYGVYPRGMGPNPTPDMPSGGEAIKSYLQGRSPEEAVRRVYGYKPGTFMTPEAYGERNALEGLREAGGIARDTRAARDAAREASQITPIERVQELETAPGATETDPLFRFNPRLTRILSPEERAIENERLSMLQQATPAKLGELAKEAEERHQTRRSIEAAKARAAGTLPSDLGQAKMAAEVNAAIHAARTSQVAESPRLDKYTHTLNALKREDLEKLVRHPNWESFQSPELADLRDALAGSAPEKSPLFPPREFGEQLSVPKQGEPRDLLGRYALARLLGLKTKLSEFPR